MINKTKSSAIIIGAGIAGPAMALQLKKLDIYVDIFEARHIQEMNQDDSLELHPTD